MKLCIILFSLCVHNSGPLYKSKSKIIQKQVVLELTSIPDFIIGGTDMPTGWLF